MYIDSLHPANTPIKALNDEEGHSYMYNKPQYLFME